MNAQADAPNWINDYTVDYLPAGTKLRPLRDQMFLICASAVLTNKPLIAIADIKINFFIFLCIYSSDEANSKKFNFTI